MERMENPTNATAGAQFIVYRIPNHPKFDFPSPARKEAIDLAGNILSSSAITFSNLQKLSSTPNFGLRGGLVPPAIPKLGSCKLVLSPTRGCG